MFENQCKSHIFYFQNDAKIKNIKKRFFNNYFCKIGVSLKIYRKNMGNNHKKYFSNGSFFPKIKKKLFLSSNTFLILYRSAIPDLKYETDFWRGFITNLAG